MLVGIPIRGGIARALLRSQLGRAVAPHLLEPAPAPAHEDVAFIERRGPVDASPCAYDRLSCELPVELLPSPALTEVWLGVARSADAPEDWSDAAHLAFDGAPSGIGQMNGVVLYESRYHPYQQAWLTRRALPFKPDWSPDATQIVTFDHEGLRIVDLAAGALSTIASGDVGNPDWSPDGEWIAFDRVERLDSVADLCVYEIFDPKQGYVPVCYERRMFYATTAPELVLVRPDGSDEQVLGPGAEPAWSPDGARLFHVADGRILVRDMATGATEPVPDTEGGEEPAVSPDGRALAFTRYDPDAGSRDVWVVSLTGD